MPSDSTFTEVKNAFQSIAGLESLTSADEFFLTSSLNSAIYRAYNESDSWPRYLVVGEERLLVDDQIVPYASGCNCKDLLAISEAQYNELSQCVESLIAPKDYDGVEAWSKSYSSTRPDYGPPYSPTNPPPCTKVISSVFKVEYLGGIQLRFTRNNTYEPSDCGASGTISIGFNGKSDGTGNNLNVQWSSGPGESSSTVNVTLDSTYYVFVAGLNLNENSPPTQYIPIGSFYVSPTGEITRTIDATISVTDGELPCELNQL